MSAVSPQRPCPMCHTSGACPLGADQGAYCPRRRYRDRTEDAALAPIAKRDVAYRALFDSFGLADAHRRHLLTERGVGAESLRWFASVRGFGRLELRELAQLAFRRAGSLAGVPGLYQDKKGGWKLVDLPPGVTIGVPDKAGRIQMMVIRRDNLDPFETEGSRYHSVSSSVKPSGCSPGAPCAVWNGERASVGVWIIEGILKAVVVAGHRGVCAVGIPGAMYWPNVRAVMLGAPRGLSVTVAFDQESDPMKAAGVGQAREALAAMLAASKLNVQIAEWPSAYKGIDDAILAGAPVTVRPWRSVLMPSVRPRFAQSLPERPRPAGVPLANALALR